VIPRAAARVAGAILAGGLGTRMGGLSKAALEVGGVRIIDRQLAVLRPLCDELVVVGGEPTLAASVGLALAPDAPGPPGPLRALAGALAATTAPVLLLLACDLPFLAEAPLRALLARAPGHDAVAPRHGGHPEPLHALYARSCLAPAHALLAAGQGRMGALLEQVDTVWLEGDALTGLDPALRFLTNVNTPKELASAAATVMMKP